MTKKQLGASQVYVSPIILGTWSMGGDYFGETEDRAGETVIRTYLENGIDTFDTAEIYGNGRAETMLGRALEGVDRGSYTLISKVFPHHYAMADMEKACDDTLKRLKTDYLDTYFLHYPPKDMTIGQAMENILTLKEKGKIRSIGVSNFTLDMLKKARNYADVDVVQPCYNLLWRYIDADLLPYCVQQGIGVIPYSTLAQGLLTGHFKKDTPITAGRMASSGCPHFGYLSGIRWAPEMCSTGHSWKCCSRACPPGNAPAGPVGPRRSSVRSPTAGTGSLRRRF